VQWGGRTHRPSHGHRRREVRTRGAVRTREQEREGERKHGTEHNTEGGEAGEGGGFDVLISVSMGLLRCRGVILLSLQLIVFPPTLPLLPSLLPDPLPSVSCAAVVG
jgi:hypothetical protein